MLNPRYLQTVVSLIVAVDGRDTLLKGFEWDDSQLQNGIQSELNFYVSGDENKFYASSQFPHVVVCGY